MDYLVTHEWAAAVEDVLWRRTKLGLRLSATEQDNLRSFFTKETMS